MAGEFERAVRRQQEMHDAKDEKVAELGDLYKLAEERYHELLPDACHGSHHTEQAFFASNPHLLREVRQFHMERRDSLERSLSLDPSEQRELAQIVRCNWAEADGYAKPYDPRYDRQVGKRVRRYFSSIRRRMHELKAQVSQINDELEDSSTIEQDRREEKPVESSYYLG